MHSDKITSFSEVLALALTPRAGITERRAREIEASTPKPAARTANMSFRCSPEFRADVKAAAAAERASMADILEQAMLAWHASREGS